MNFIELHLEDTAEIESMSCLASAIVKEHYDPIIGAAQNDYMIARFQSVSGILDHMRQGARYYFADAGGIHIGYLAFLYCEKGIYLSKFYLEKSHRGKGYSKEMLLFLVQCAREKGLPLIYLNCNRHNGSAQIYEALGFVKTGEEVTDIGGGFVMDDFIYTYVLPETTQNRGEER